VGEDGGLPESGDAEGVDEYVGHVVRRDIDAADLVHGLHPGAEEHASQDARGAFAGKELPPGVGVHVFSVEHVFDDVELRLDGCGVDGGTVAF
jgi:hypothetical protein